MYDIYNCLLNFEFGYFNISFVGLVNFLSFCRTESLVTTAITMLEAEAIQNVLDNKNVVRITGSGERKEKKRGSVSLFIVIIVIGLDDVYFTRFLIFLFFTFTFRFVIIAFFSVVATFAFFTAVLFVRTVFRKIYIAFKIATFVTMFIIPFESLRL